MKITDICESTTAGSVATVAAPMNGRSLKRVGQGVYGKEKGGNLLTGKKTSKPFANSISEAAGEFKGEHVTVLYVDDKPAVKYTDITKAKKEMEILKKNLPNKKFELKTEIREAGMPQSVLRNKQKLAGMTDAELADHLKGKSDDELKRLAWRHGYGNMSPHYVNRIKKVTESKAMYKAHLEEDDLILVPGQGHRLKSGFIPHAEDRRDHEVEMARSDLYQAHKNSSKIHKLIKNVSEDEGLEGWVQAKITKAADYLNSVRQYLEGKQLQEMTGGVIAGGGVGESLDGGPLDTNSMMYDSHFAAHYEKQSPDVQSSLDTYLKAGLSYPDAVDKVTNGPSAAKYRITPLRAGPLLGRGMSSDARARDIDRSDIEYIEQRQFKDQWKQENPGKKWPGYDEAGFKSRYASKWD